MKFKRLIGLLSVFALCTLAFTACNKTTTESFGTEGEAESEIPTGTYETLPESESGAGETEPESVIESETAETEASSTSEAESEGEEAPVESDFTQSVLYAARIDGFDINSGKLTVTMCSVPAEKSVLKLSAGDFTPGSEKRSLVLPGNTKVLTVDGGEVSTVSMEEIATDIFAVLEGDESYMELYIYAD